MAELLIKAIDATHTDPTKDIRGCFKKGDIICIMPDGWSWGKEEVIPPATGGKFYIVKVPGVLPSTLSQLTRPRRNAQGQVTIRRNFTVDATVFTAKELEDSNTLGVITVNSQKLNNAAKAKS